MEEKKLVTQPHNPYLLETFRAFLSEGLAPPMAAAMTQAHINHGIMATLQDISKTFERIAAMTDPVRAADFLAFLDAAEENIRQARERHDGEESVRTFNEVFGLSDE